MCAHPSFHFCFLVKDLFVVCDCSLEINFPTHICKQCAFRFCLGGWNIRFVWTMSYDRRSSIHERVRVIAPWVIEGHQFTNVCVFRPVIAPSAEKNTRFYKKKTIKTAFLSVQPQKNFACGGLFIYLFFKYLALDFFKSERQILAGGGSNNWSDNKTYLLRPYNTTRRLCLVFVRSNGIFRDSPINLFSITRGCCENCWRIMTWWTIYVLSSQFVVRNETCIMRSCTHKSWPGI